MPYGVYLSAAGANAQSNRLQTLSHNLANVDTPGFKPQESILQARFAELIEEGEVGSGMGGIDDLGGGVTIQPSQTNFSVGAMKTTGRETDFAINDESSFFVMERDGEQLLTRAGDFLFNSSGQLISQTNDLVLGSDGQPIQIEPGKPFQVGAEGRISQGGETWELMLAQPKSMGDVSRVGTNAFKPLAEFDLVPKGERRVVAGTLEHSAVSPTSAMMELIETSRVYEANVRMIQHQDSVMGTLIGRVLQ
ncbi:MAG: flagellar hook-basal body protein [Rubripirellula sp.]